MDESTLCCLHCNEVFITKSSLTEHFRELHAADVPRRKIARYLCDFCPKHFADSWTAKHHKKTVHLSVREHSCDTCKKAFLSKKDLRRHIKGVHEKQRIIYPGQKTKGRKQDKLLLRNHLVDAESEDGPEDGGEQEQVEDDGGETDQARLGEHGSNQTESSSRDPQYTEDLLTVDNHDLINTSGSFSDQLNPSSDLHSKSDLEFISPELFSNLPKMFANYSNSLFSEEELSCTGARVSVNVSQTSTPISGLPVNISRLSFPVNTIERRRRKGSPLKMVSREGLLNTSLPEPNDPERFVRNGSVDSETIVDEIEAGSKVDFDQGEDLDADDGYENAKSDEDDSSQDGFNDQVGPVFQLENLENLQLVLPEQGEPQIVIPETGIRLKISGKSRSRSNDADSQVLTIVPGTSEQTKECEELIGEGEENLYYISPYQAQALGLEGEGEKETNQEHDQGEIVLNSDRPESINFQSDNSEDEEIISTVSLVSSNINQNNCAESAVSGVRVYNKMADNNKLEDFTHFEINNRVVLLNASSSLEIDRVDCLEEKIAKLIDERSGKIDLSRAVSCDLCDRRFISEEYLNKHIKELHPASPRFMLELDQGLISGAMFEDLVEGPSIAEPTMLPICEVLETKTTYKCDQCEEEFKLKGLLTKHKKNNHNVKLKFECKQCEKCFSSDQSLKLHTTSVHDGVSSVCRICFKPVIDITRHIRLQHRNTEERFACQLCHLRFRTLFSMQRHKMMVHLKLRPYTCDYCEKSFGSKRDMERHKKSQHFQIKNIERKEWTCPLCKISFDKRNKYDRHKKSVHNNSSDLEILSFLSGELKSRVMEVVIDSSSQDLRS